MLACIMCAVYTSPVERLGFRVNTASSIVAHDNDSAQEQNNASVSFSIAETCCRRFSERDCAMHVITDLL